MADPQSIEKEDKEIVVQTLDTSTDVNQIKTDIDAIKKSVDDLNADMADFEKTKNTFVKEIIQQKQKEFEARRLEIENKKKEIQDLIVKTRRDCDVLKDEVLKSQARNELTQYEKELSDITPPKQKGWIADQRGHLRDKEEWKHNTLGNLGRAAGFTATGIGIVWGVKKLRNWISGGDEETYYENGEKKKRKKQKKKKSFRSRVKNFLKWGTIGAGIAYLGRGLFTGKWDFFGLGQEKKEGGGNSQTPGANPETSQQEYAEKLTIEEKRRYNGFADNANSFFGKNVGILPTDIASDRLGDDKMEIYKGEKMQGLVPFMLNNRYADVSHILSENAFCYEVVSSDAHSIIDQLRKWSAKEIYDYLLPVAKSADSSFNSSLLSNLTTLNLSGKVDDFMKYIEGNQETKDMIATSFRKSLSVTTYLTTRRTRLQYQIVSDYLSKQDHEFASKSPEDQQDMIKDKLDDEEFMKQHVDGEIKNNFDDKTLYEAIGYLEQKKCLDDSLDDATALELQKIDDRKNELLDEDEGHNVLSRMKEKTPEGGTLDKESTDDFSDILGGFDKRINSVGRQSFLNKYLPLRNMVDPEDMITDQILKSGAYENLVKGFADKIDALREKAKKGTLTASDIDELQKEINDYVSFEKSLRLSTMSVDKNFDENGNLVLRYFTTIRVSGKTFVSAVTMMIQKKDVTLEGLGIAAGAAVSLDIATYPIRAIITRGKASSPSLKAAYKLGKFVFKGGLKLTGKTIEYSLKNHVPAWIGKYFYRGKEALFRYEFATGDLSLEKALEIAKANKIKIGANTVINEDMLLRRAIGHEGGGALTEEEVSLLKRYWNNSSLRKQLVHNQFVGNRRHPSDWVRYKSNSNFTLESSAYQKLQSIDIKLTKLSGTESKIFSVMMKNIKDLDVAEQLLSKGIDPKYLAYFEGAAKWMSAEDFGKYLGRYAKNLKGKTLSQIIDFVKESQSAGKVTNSSVFVRNALRNFSTIETYNTEAKKLAYGVYEVRKTLNIADFASEKLNFQIAEELMKAKNLEEAKLILVKYGIKDIAQIEKLTKGVKFNKLSALAESVGNLNLSGYEKMSMKVKTGVNSMIRNLKDFLKNPKMKIFHSGITKKITGLTEYVETVTPESIKAIRSGNSRIDVITGFGNLSKEGILALKNVRNLIATDKSGALLKSLQTAKNADEVKDALVKGGMTAEEAASIDAKVLNKIASTKNIKKITNIVEYGAEIEALSAFKKVLSNPVTKMLGRYLLVVGVILDFACTGWEFYEQTKEAEEVKKYNAIRGITIEQKAYFDVVTGGLSAVAGTIALVGFANEWNPVGRVCTIVAGVLIGIKALGDETIGEINKYQQNYKDFLMKDLPSIKQHIVYVNSWQAGLDSSLQDFFSTISFQSDFMNSWKKNMSVKTIADAVKAVIYWEELQKYPLAGYDLNDEKVRNDSELKPLVEQQKKLHDDAVAQRFEYIQKKYISTGKNIVSAQQLQNNTGVQALDDVLAESRMYQATMADENCTNKMDVGKYQGQSAEALKKMDAKGFESLENLYQTNPRYFYEVVASLPYYESMASNYKVGDSDYQKILVNLEFVKQYVAYKMLGKSFADIPVTNFDPEKINYNDLNAFLLSFAVSSSSLTPEDIKSDKINYLTQANVLDKYDVSLHMGQNILYEIARGGFSTTKGVETKKFAGLGYTGKNNMEELKKFFVEGRKEIVGIYYDGEEWVINENRGSDNEIGTDNELNTVEGVTCLREYIYDAGHGSGTGDMVIENDRINIEYVNNFVNIIDENLQYRQNPKLYKDAILQYIKNNSNGGYIELDPDSIVRGTKAGIKNVGAFVYSYDSTTGKFDAKTKIANVTCELLK